jgi:hypothetical protein
MFGRIRLPPPARRFIRSRLRQAVVDDFLATCEQRGAATVGFVELRDWFLGRGLDFLAAPIRAKVRVWQILIGTVVALIFAGALLLAIRS